MSATLTMEVREKEENVHEKRHVKDETLLGVSGHRQEGEGGQQSEAARPQ